ncbi:MAG: DUF72 domain-containing protein [Bryobacteraceae bacterium]
MPSVATPQLYAGTSGFAYPSWKPDFYPAKLASANFLNYYSTRLNLVEVNYTFRRIASASTFAKWVAGTPEGFRFSPKAHMKITHSLKLNDAEDFTRFFLESLEPLRQAGRLAPILFQLAPSFKADRERLGAFISKLPKHDRYTFEFRHASWFDEPIYAALRENNVALCLAENEKLETPEVVTADFVYLRLRKEDYSEEEQAQLATQVKNHLIAGQTVYALFKHEDTPAGAFCAEKLIKAAAL